MSLVPSMLYAQKDGNFSFKYKNGFYYLVNAKGKKVDKVPYGFASEFSEGLAVVEKNMKFGYIDTTGTVVIPLKFYDAGPFRNGKAYAFNGYGYGYIDKSGTFTIDPKYKYAQSFDGDLAKVHVENFNSNQFGDYNMIFGLINKDGSLLGNRYFTSIFRPNDSEIYKGRCQDSIFSVHPDGSIELINILGKNIKPNAPITREVMPEYPGGGKEIKKFITMNTRYPSSAKQIKFQGRVLISFIVNEDGKIKDIRPATPKAPVLMQEGMRVVSLLSDWEPGYQNDKPVAVEFTVQINFRHP